MALSLVRDTGDQPEDILNNSFGPLFAIEEKDFDRIIAAQPEIIRPTIREILAIDQAAKKRTDNLETENHTLNTADDGKYIHMVALGADRQSLILKTTKRDDMGIGILYANTLSETSMFPPNADPRLRYTGTSYGLFGSLKERMVINAKASGLGDTFEVTSSERTKYGNPDKTLNINRGKDPAANIIMENIEYQTPQSLIESFRKRLFDAAIENNVDLPEELLPMF